MTKNCPIPNYEEFIYKRLAVPEACTSLVAANILGGIYCKNDQCPAYHYRWYAVT
jgi:hypothetical protein